MEMKHLKIPESVTKEKFVPENEVIIKLLLPQLMRASCNEIINYLSQGCLQSKAHLPLAYNLTLAWIWPKDDLDPVYDFGPLILANIYNPTKIEASVSAHSIQTLWKQHRTRVRGR